MIGIVDKTHIDGDSQLRLRRITVGRYCLVVLIVSCDFSVNLQVRILIRLEQLQTGLPDEDIFQVLIEFGCQRSIYILRLDRKVGYRNGLSLIIIDRRSVKLIGNSARNDYQRQAEQ